MKKFSLIALLAVSSLFGKVEWFNETLYEDWAQSFKVGKVVYRDQTEFQDLIIFDNPFYGRVFALDGIIQLTERDEFCYHEMLTHVPLLSHGNVKKVLVIGGGDGGIIREVLKHKTVEEVTLVEIDAGVVQFAKDYLPFVSKGAFDDPRLNVVIADGNKYVQESKELYDVIICDSTDPIGPAAVLFSEGFYAACGKRLADGGIFVTQNGVPFLQTDELRETNRLFKKLFKHATFFSSVVPTYVGGIMTFGWASKGKEYAPSVEEVRARLQENVSGEMRYYTPEVHKASFALPVFIQKVIQE